MENFEIIIKNKTNSITMNGALIELKRFENVSVETWIGPILHNVFITLDSYLKNSNYFEFYILTDFIKLKLCYDNNYIEIQNKIRGTLTLLSDGMTYSDYSRYTNLEKYFYSTKIYKQIKKLGCEYTSVCWGSKLEEYK